jgi:hypothetical protein
MYGSVNGFYSLPQTFAIPSTLDVVTVDTVTENVSGLSTMGEAIVSDLGTDLVVSTDSTKRLKTGLTTFTEVEYVHGVTSAIQDQLTRKISTYATDATYWDTTPTSASTLPVTSGGIYTALGTKQDTITGGATTITSSNLTASRALASDSTGKVVVSTTTDTELALLHGINGSVVDTGSTQTLTGDKTFSGTTTLSTCTIGSNSHPATFNGNGIFNNYVVFQSGAQVDFMKDSAGTIQQFSVNRSGWPALSVKDSVTGSGFGISFCPYSADAGYTNAIRARIGTDGSTGTDMSIAYTNSLATGCHKFYTNTTGSGNNFAEVLRINNTGKVGILQTNPQDSLHIGGSGSVRIDGLTASTALALNSNKSIVSSTCGATALGYCANLSSDAQTQLSNRPTAYAGTSTTASTATVIACSNGTTDSSGQVTVSLPYSVWGSGSAPIMVCSTISSTNSDAAHIASVTANIGTSKWDFVLQAYNSTSGAALGSGKTISWHAMTA